MSGKLTGRVCIITGATGIAEATARLAAREGAAVFFAGLDEQSCRKLASRIQSAGGSCAYLAADLSRERAARSLVKSCVKRFGRIDALYNVAGMSGRKYGDGPLHECTEKGWDLTFRNNLKTTFLVSRAVVRQMLKQPIRENGLRGTILNMASVLAFSPEPRFFAAHAYAASKGAIISLTKAMAAYYAPKKIRVNALAPGLVRTPMSLRAQQNSKIRSFVKTRQALRQDLLDAEDVAHSALFLLSDESRAVTGEIFTVDAGWCVGGG